MTDIETIRETLLQRPSVLRQSLALEALDRVEAELDRLREHTAKVEAVAESQSRERMEAQREVVQARARVAELEAMLTDALGEEETP
jgi:chromosome segregation ATPase